VDTGSFSAAERAAIAARSKEVGAVAHHHLDARETFYTDFVSWVIKANYMRGGVYPACVGPERVVAAKAVAELAQRLGIDTVVHGSTGAGNDQIRFDLALRVLAPGLTVLAPIRELGLTRAAETAYLRERGFPVSDAVKDYSINVGLLGTTIGGKETLGTLGVPAESAYTLTTAPEQAPNTPETLTIQFQDGLPVALDGTRYADGCALIGALNARAGAHGIGRGVHLGTTVLGIKGRVAFEAPALVTLISAHVELEKAVLTSKQIFWKGQLGTLYGDMLHEGLYFDPLMRDLEAFMASSQGRVTGTVSLSLYKGHVTILGSQSPFSLMAHDVAVYGEQNAYWSGRDAEGFSRLYGLEGLIAAKALRKGESHVPVLV
jgi:argininosuccinate synthase